MTSEVIHIPIYEYECRDCGHRFEALVRTSILPACPSCESQNLERMLSIFAVDSESTRKSALKAGKRHRDKTGRDRLIAEREERLRHQH